MPRKVKCALIQTSCDWSTPKHSLVDIKKKMIDKHIPLIERAGKQGVQILCMQEIFYGPYFCAEQDTKWYDTAEPVPGPTTEIMQKLGWKPGDQYGVEVVGKKVQVYRFRLAPEE